MIASLIFTILAITTTSVYIQNYRMITSFRYRTHATNAALNILEQLRVRQYTEIKTIHDAATSTIMVSLVDPTYSKPSPDPYPELPLPYRPIDLKINVLDGVQKDAQWTAVDLPLENTATTLRMKTQFWTTVNQTISATAPVVELFEIVVMYQWKNPSPSAQAWQSGTVRLTIPNPNPKK